MNWSNLCCRCCVCVCLPMVQHGYWAVRMDTSRECLMQIHSSPAVLQYLGGTWQNARGDTKTTSKKIWHKNLVGKMSYIRKDNGGIWMCQKREKNKMLCRLFPAEEPRKTAQECSSQGASCGDQAAQGFHHLNQSRAIYQAAAGTPGVPCLPMCWQTGKGTSTSNSGVPVFWVTSSLIV